MRDRLIELIKQKSFVYVPCDRDCGGCDNTEMYEDSIISLADHLLANGVIVPPCKVGDTVYYVYKGNTIVNALVEDWKKEASGDWLFRACFSMNGSSVTLLFGDNKIGKTVFLTREEAEKALAESDQTQKTLM